MVSVADVIAVLGLVSLAVGLWMVWPPVALIVVGVLFLLAGWRGEVRRGPSR